MCDSVCGPYHLCVAPCSVMCASKVARGHATYVDSEILKIEF